MRVFGEGRWFERVARAECVCVYTCACAIDTFVAQEEMFEGSLAQLFNEL